MKNTNIHQSVHCVFSQQADTSLEQHLPTSGLVLAVPRTESLAPAALIRDLPLAVELDTKRDPAPQPAIPKAEWLNQPTPQDSPVFWTKQGTRTSTVPTHTRPAKRDVQHDILLPVSSRTNAQRPHSEAQTQASKRPAAGEVHQHTGKSPASKEPAGRPLGSVRQDNARFATARQASRQPAADKNIIRSQTTNNRVVRSKTHNGARQNLAQVTLWVDPVVKAHLERLALQEGLSVSAAGAAFLRRALQQDVDLRYSALLQPIIEHAIAKQMRGISTRLAWLLVRVSIDSGQTRSLVTNILGRQPGMTTDLLRSIVKQSADTARGNITRRTPQIEDLIQSVENWLTTDERRERN